MSWLPSSLMRRPSAEGSAARARLAAVRPPRGWVPMVPQHATPVADPGRGGSVTGAEDEDGVSGARDHAVAADEDADAADEDADERHEAAGVDALHDRGPVGPRASHRRRSAARSPWRARVLDLLPARLQVLALRSRLRAGHAAALVVVALVGVVAAAVLARAAAPEVVLAPDPVAETAATVGPSGPAPPAAAPTGPSTGSSVGSSRGAAPSAGPEQPPAAGAPATVVVVHVAGRVRAPGVRSLPVGSRVVDAVRAAGGALPGTDLARLNLARVLVDGEQVAVGLAPSEAAPVTGPTPPAGSGRAAAAGGSGGSAAVDLNTATLEQLDSLPGVGPVLAQRILDWRAEHGRFTNVEELGEVSGIGEAKLADLRPRVVVG